MSFSHEYNFPLYVGTGGVLTDITKTSADLVKGQLGVISAKNGQVLSGATPAQSNIQIASGSWHKKDMLAKYTGGLTQSDKTIEFNTRGILGFERSYPRAAQSEQWVLGWDGLNTCLGPQFEASKTYRFKVKVWGEDVYATYTRPVEREISYTTPCPVASSDCSTGNCSDPVDTKAAFYEIKKLIENDPELKYFVKADVISSDYAATSATHKLTNLTVCDTGDQIALGAVQANYPGVQITRIDRKGSISTYQACVTTATTLATFTPTSDILLADCAGACPAGYSAVASKDVWIVTRALLPTTDLNSTADQTTFAAAIVTAYSGVTAANGVFLSFNASTAKVQIDVVAGSAVAAINGSDLVVKVATKAAVCTPPAGSAISWVDSGNRYKTTRTLYMTVQKACGTATRLTEMQAFYANDATVVASSLLVSSTGTCNDKYVIQQYSNECALDACLSKPVPTFNNLQAFEGQLWSADYCPTPGAVDTSIKVGLVLTAAYVGNDKFGSCSFNPNDYYSVRPLKIEITQLTGIGTLHFDQQGNPCDSPIATRKIRNSSMPTQSGEFVIREYIRANRYRVHGEDYLDPRLREALDSSAREIVDVNKSYVTYHLKVQQDRSGRNHTADFSPEIFEFVFAFPQGTNTTAFETLIESFSSQNGVFLQAR